MEKYKMFQTTNQDYNGQSIETLILKRMMRGPPVFFWNLQIHWIEKHTWISFWSQTHILYRILVSGTLHCCLQTHVPSIPIHVSIRFHLSIPFLHFLSNVGKTINQPFGNGLHNLINLFMVILGVVYYWFNHIIGLPAVDSTPQVQPHTTLRNMGDKLPGHCRRFSGMCWRGFFYDARRLGFLGDVKRCVPLNMPMYTYMYIYIYIGREKERDRERENICCTQYTY